MALAATGSPELAEKTSAASARELHAAGINWVYSPVCDVNSDPLNPVIGQSLVSGCGESDASDRRSFLR